MKTNVGDYLLNRLKELGIKHIFGVPGDYNLGFLDQIVNDKDLTWIGNCNELNASYAADGYARINGAGALVTTFGVGELSAINGIAGAYAEYVPVVKIVGMPALTTQQRKAIVHHTLGGGDFNVFAKMYSNVTIAQTLLTEFSSVSDIDRVLTECWLLKRPVYIGIPTDISYKTIEVDAKPLNLNYPTSNSDAVKEAVSRTAAFVRKAKKPVFLVDICAARHPMKSLILELIEKTGIPIATMNMGKGVIDESHPKFLGNYNGDFSSPGIQDRVEQSDCIISFGTVLSDFNTGGFTAKLNANVEVEVHSHHVQLKHSIYNNLYFTDFIPALIKQLEGVHFDEVVQKPKQASYTASQQPITQERFWLRMSRFLESGDIVLAEAGTSLFGTLPMTIPDEVDYLNQTLWGSIGYTVGALLGTVIAAPDRQSVLFVGDGSFQLTAQEVSTIIRHQGNPIIFLINNDGYTIERVIHGPTMEYNDIKMWHYAELPKVFGDHVWTTKVGDEVALEKALEDAKNIPDKLRFIEVIMDRDDMPDVLRKVGEACAEQNKYN